MPKRIFVDGICFLSKECLSPNQLKNYVSRMEKEGVARVKMLSIVTGSYLIFWGPLFIVTVWNWNWSWAQAKNSIAHEVGGNNFIFPCSPFSIQVSLHISYCHSIVTPLLYLVLHPGLRRAAQVMACCRPSGTQTRQQDGSTGEQHSQGSTENR